MQFAAILTGRYRDPVIGRNPAVGDLCPSSLYLLAGLPETFCHFQPKATVKPADSTLNQPKLEESSVRIYKYNVNFSLCISHIVYPILHI